MKLACLSLFVTVVAPWVAQAQEYYSGYGEQGGRPSNPSRRDLFAPDYDGNQTDTDEATPLTPGEMDMVRNAVEAYRSRKQSGARLETIVVPVCFHNVYYQGSQYNSNEDLQAQLDHVNEAFTSASCCDTQYDWCEEGMCSQDTRFRFEMAVLDPDSDNGLSGETTPLVTDPNACVTLTVNDEWADGANDRTPMMLALHLGGWETLNAYIQSGLYSGAALYPWRAKRYNIGVDGVRFGPTKFPGQPNTNGEGDTMVHEIGHWLGLPHTFAHGCEASDGFLDTPRQASANWECPTTQDSCPDSPGTDPIHNFMDYTWHLCRYEFTPGQVEYMEAVYEELRLQPDWGADDLEEIPLEVGVPSDPTILLGAADVQLFTFNSTGCCFNCTAEATEGDMRMFVRFDGVPTYDDQDDCASEGPNTYNQSCDVVMDVSKVVGDDEPVVEIAQQRPIRRIFNRFCGDSGGDTGDDGEDVSLCPTTCESTKVYVGIESGQETDRAGVSDLVVTCNECCI